MHSIFYRVKQQQLQNLPFVIYRKPHSKTIVGVFQNNDHLYFSDNFSEKGFVFAPFEGTPIIFPLENSETKYNNVYFEKDFEKHDIPLEEKLFEKEFFTSLVKKGVFAIKRGDFSKVVLSRKEEIEIPEFAYKQTVEEIKKP